MKRHDLMALALAGTLTFSLLAGCNQTEAREDSGHEVGETQAQSNGGDSTGALAIAEQGIFSAGGITLTSEGTFEPENQWEETGAGQTAHVDHANVLYQIPEEETGLPMVSCTATANRAWAG